LERLLVVYDWEGDMTAFNIVRFRVKPGHQERFIVAHRALRPAFKGFRAGSLARTGDNSFCIIGGWTSIAKLFNAMARMIGVLESLRGHLEDLGGGIGVTDRASGEVVVRLAASKSAKSRAKINTRKRTNRHWLRLQSGSANKFVDREVGTGCAIQI
jgi:hypothetical protein